MKTIRAACHHPGCREVTFYEYRNRREMLDSERYAQKWKCLRHTGVETMSPVETSRVKELVATDLPASSGGTLGRFWVAEGESGNGFAHGPGFRAFAEDFPAGTRLRITAEILPKDSE